MVFCLGLSGCDDEHPWNDPYPLENARANTVYTSFSERPKHLDPAKSYSASEWAIICQIYEPPLQYHYLKRPYMLEALAATDLPEIQWFGQDGKRIEGTQGEIAYTDYIIRIKPNILYQPHPAFAKNEKGEYRYLNLSKEEAQKMHTLKDFKETGTRELIAEDYVYQIKRLADPNLSSPIFGLMSQHIVGLQNLRDALLKASPASETTEHDLQQSVLEGVTVLDRYTYRIRIKGQYPQFRYWLAMPFFAPVPWEVARFYAQPGFLEHNISLDWYPVGTGPFMLVENNPDRRMKLKKNPNFRGEKYPLAGAPNDAEQGFLADAGQTIPFIDSVIYTLEKEDIPLWAKFLQGYYDISGISSDNFTSAVHFLPSGHLEVTQDLKNKGIRLQTSVSPEVFYWGFNFLDPVVGGVGEKARKLRKALSQVLDIREFIDIFMNGRGVLAQGPIPPNVFGFETQPKENKGSLEEARRLLQEAGFAEGLTLYLDSIVTGNPDEIALQAWLKEQFQKVDIELIIRGTDYNRFQDKIRHGNAQLFFFGWNADYPDPENFLFLFYGPNGSAQFGGENTVNYSNPNYDELFLKMRVLPDGAERLQIIQQMIDILQKDVPWIWGFYPKSFGLYQDWMRISKPSGLINNTLKYAKINPILRAEQRLKWNQPLWWPLWILFGLIFLFLLPVCIQFWRNQHTPRERI